MRLKKTGRNEKIISKEYLWRIRKILETKLKMETWAVLIGRYEGLFLSWTKEEIKSIDKETHDNAEGCAPQTL